MSPPNLLDLPPEIRDHILHLVCKTSSIVVHPHAEPAVSMTCRSLREEALSVYYGHNRFRVAVGPGGRHGPLDATNKWLSRVAAANLKHIRSFAFLNIYNASVLEVDFNIRGQDYSVTHWSTRTQWLNDTSFAWFDPQKDLNESHRFITHLLAYQKDQKPDIFEDHYNYHADTQYLGDLFKRRVWTVVSAAILRDTSELSMSQLAKEARGLRRQWTLCKGFTASSIERLAELLGHDDTTFENIWLGNSG